MFKLEPMGLRPGKQRSAPFPFPLLLRKVSVGPDLPGRVGQLRPRLHKA